MGTFYFTSADGTRIRGWRNGGSGEVVVLVPGLGTVPESFPSLCDPDCGFDVVSFYQRGTFGSERPADPSAITVAHHVEDTEALMATLGIERALFASWSLGVNAAFEFAVKHPEQVRGLLAVGGVPGGTFDTMLAPLHVPPGLRRLASSSMVHALQAAGPLLTEVSRRVPVNDSTSRLLARSGFMMPGSDPAHLTRLLQDFARNDWSWFFTLAKAHATHERMDVSDLDMPLTFFAASQDVMTSRDDILEVASHIPQARVCVVNGSHFIGLEHPGAIVRELLNLQSRAEQYEELERSARRKAAG